MATSNEGSTFLSKSWFAEDENRPYYVAAGSLVLGALAAFLITYFVMKSKYERE